MQISRLVNQEWVNVLFVKLAFECKQACSALEPPEKAQGNRRQAISVLRPMSTPQCHNHDLTCFITSTSIWVGVCEDSAPIFILQHHNWGTWIHFYTDYAVASQFCAFYERTHIEQISPLLSVNCGICNLIIKSKEKTNWTSDSHQTSNRCATAHICKFRNAAYVKEIAKNMEHLRYIRTNSGPISKTKVQNNRGSTTSGHDILLFVTIAKGNWEFAALDQRYGNLF